MTTVPAFRQLVGNLDKRDQIREDRRVVKREHIA